MEKTLKFKDGKFRILQLSDMQDTYNTSPDTVRFTEEAIKITKPDFIVLTGDQIKGYGLSFLKGDNKTNAAKAINALMAPIGESGIPFTAVFGNHDAFGEAQKDFQWKCYKCFDNFIGNDYETAVFPVYSENEENVPFCVYTFDYDAGENKANGLSKDGKITEKQINKYRNYRDILSEKYGHTVKALAFQHVPPAEMYDCLKEVKKGTKNSVQGAGIHKDQYYTLPDYAVKKGSFMGENPASPDEKSGQLEAFEEKNDVMGLYFGHDHNNSFIVKWNNIDLGYTQGCGFNVYGPGHLRGGRVFDIYESEPDKYKKFTVTYKDILGARTKRPVKTFMYTHSPSSVSAVEAQCKKIAKAAAVCAVPVAAAYILKKLK